MLRRGIAARLPRARLLRVVHAALRAERVKVSGELTIVVTNNHIMRRLNTRFHHQATTTDVLAFPIVGELRGPPPHPYPLPQGERGRLHHSFPLWFVADVVISWDRARLQAKVMGHSTTRELEWLALHGVLHLLGYRDHHPGERVRMEARQRAVWGSSHV
ncbi:MAG: rRNA maturation RNase YbeY [Elusimicrobia bacterium]|nr:rRNA maturation RNase YbeY [Elusimicrobiota bacterium]